MCSWSLAGISVRLIEEVLDEPANPVTRSVGLMRFRAMPLYHVRPAAGRDFPRSPLRNWDRLFREVRAFFPAVGRLFDMAAANTELRGLVENLGVIRAHLERTGILCSYWRAKRGYVRLRLVGVRDLDLAGRWPAQPDPARSTRRSNKCFGLGIPDGQGCSQSRNCVGRGSCWPKGLGRSVRRGAGMHEADDHHVRCTCVGLLGLSASVGPRTSA
mmetsp:Transcript_113035/g.269472  ORF Transcript_113035/g.269472 Transcript_113035/m.269472 type:complete len:215 (+) Transcript_113035:262-906(+)